MRSDGGSRGGLLVFFVQPAAFLRGTADLELCPLNDVFVSLEELQDLPNRRRAQIHLGELKSRALREEREEIERISHEGHPRARPGSSSDAERSGEDRPLSFVLIVLVS